MPAMSSDTKALKRQLRTHCLARRTALAGAGLASASRGIAGRLCAEAEYTGARVIHTYVSKAQEVETDGIVRRALEEGRRVVVPVVAAGQRDLRHAEIECLDELVPGPFGLRQPASASARWIEQSGILDLVLVPGLAFDANGNRVGYGRGYYDRFLGRVAAPLVGLVPNALLIEEVPMDEHDVPVDLVLTETITMRRREQR